METLDQQTDDKLYELVSDYMRNNKMFTSLDITNLAKDVGLQVRNYQVADWLRRNVIVLAHASSHQYNQSLIKVDSKAAGMTLAYLYHHYQSDPDSYLDRDQNPKPFLSQQRKSCLPFPTNVSAFTTALASVTGANLPSGILYFDTRTEAREFARDNSDTFRFKDQFNRGPAVHASKRWSCVPR